MKISVSASIIAASLLTSCATHGPIAEQANDLGFGFRRVVVAESSNSSFESAGHFSYLEYKGRRLGQTDIWSVSPSGTYAIYQDGKSGNLILFRSRDGAITQLTSRFVAPADSFEWHEENRFVEAHFGNGHGVQTFVLE